MSKFIAMLRDSYKEAVDGWIFLVMLILSGVLILIVASMSATPVGAEKAVPEMVRTERFNFVSADRGRSSRTAIFGITPSVTGVAAESQVGEPWRAETRFALEFASGGFGPSGAEVGEATSATEIKKENLKPIDTPGRLFSDPFEDAVRYWAAPAGTPAKEWPAYTDALAAEFLTYQIGATSGLRVTKVEPAGRRKFAVTAAGSPRIVWPHTPSLFFGAVNMTALPRPLGKLVNTVENTLVNGFGAWAVLLAGVVVTAGFIPNMLRKGSIDLLLTKPLSRPLILLYKYLGGLTFVFLLTAFTAVGIWLALGLRTGVWAPGLLFATFAVTFYFAILYACSTLFGVLSRNAIVSIVTTCVFWFSVFLIGTVHNAVTQLNNLDLSASQPRSVKAQKGKDKNEKKDEAVAEAEMPDLKPPQWLVTTTTILNRVTPRTNDLDTLTSRVIGEDLLPEADRRVAEKAMTGVNWPEVIGVSLAWIGLFLGLATARFVTRSY